MKKHLIIPLALLGLALTVAFQTTPETLAIGANAPKTDLKMMDISGKKITLKDIRKDNGLLVIFSCNTCPFVIGSEGSEGWEGRYAGLNKIATEHGVGMVLVNSNEAKRDAGDNLSDMKDRAKNHGFADCHYVLDEKSELANAFFARTTPHVYLFDKNMKLVYKGSIDDNVDDSKKVTQHYLTDAIKNLSKGLTIDPAETKPKGCSIKRVS
ncbi:MAG: redoxin domain-containing protein [Flavobacteriales bacterium]|nr:redoxin domain-containing protein [Flavobacteriales bacterium]